MTTLYLLALLGLAPVSGGDADVSSLVQTRLLAFESQKDGGTAAVFTVVSMVTSGISDCRGCLSTGFQMRCGNVLSRFTYNLESGLMCIGEYDGSNPNFARESNICKVLPWGLQTGVLNNQTVILRSNGVHTYQLTDGFNTNYVYRSDFSGDAYADYASCTLRTSVAGGGEVQSADAGRALAPGETKCEESGSGARRQRHCLTLQAGPGSYSESSLAEDYVIDSGNWPAVCMAHGVSQLKSYWSKEYNATGAGAYSLSRAASTQAFPHVAQVFGCPVVQGGSKRYDMRVTVALAVSLGGQVVSYMDGVAKVNGIAVGEGTTYKGELILSVNGDSVTMQGPSDGNPWGFVQIRLVRRAAEFSPTGYLLDVYVQIPDSAVSGASGLCKEQGDEFVASPFENLFPDADLTRLTATCCPSGGCVAANPAESPPAQICEACSPEVTYNDVFAACHGLTTAGLNRSYCSVDYCASCGADSAVPPLPQDYAVAPLDPRPEEDPYALVFTALSNVTECSDCSPTGFTLLCGPKSTAETYASFGWQGSNALLSMREGFSISQVSPNMGWSLPKDVVHNQTVILRSNGVHTYILKHGSDPNYVYRTDFTLDKYFPESFELSTCKIFAGENMGSNSDSVRVLPGETHCYTASSRRGDVHCVKVPAGPEIYTRYELEKPYNEGDGDRAMVCMARGVAEYSTWSQGDYSMAAAGPYVLAQKAAAPFVHQVQSFSCPVKQSGARVLNGDVSVQVALALRLGGRTVTYVDGALRVNGGAPVGEGTWYKGNLTLVVGADGTVVMQGPVGDGPWDFVQIKLVKREASFSPFGYLLDIYVQVPAAAADNSTGLCQEKGDQFVSDEGAILFSTEELTSLRETCCPDASRCSAADPEVDVPGNDDVCGSCTPPYALGAAERSCRGEEFAESCVREACANCGDGDFVPPTRQDYPKPPVSDGPPGAVADPHCRNVRGEKFDVHATGDLTFLRTPRVVADDAEPDLLVTALVERLGSQACDPTVIVALEVSGLWLSAYSNRSLLFSPGADLAPDVPEEWQAVLSAGRRPGGGLSLSRHGTRADLASLVLEVKGLRLFVNQRTGKSGMKYLDLRVHGLESLGAQAGGLLGLDDHEAASRPSPLCRGRKSAVRLFSAADSDGEGGGPAFQGDDDRGDGGLASLAWAADEAA